MEKTQITTTDDLKFGFYGYVYHMGTFGDHELYVAEIADPYENETGWECGEWYLVKDNQAIHIANCDGYNGISWRLSDEAMLDLLGNEDAVENVKESVMPYNITGDLIAAAREATLEDADAGYDDNCRVWVTRCYSSGTLGTPSDGFLTDDKGDDMLFATAADAQSYIDELEDNTYILSHGELARPTYRVVKN